MEPANWFITAGDSNVDHPREERSTRHEPRSSDAVVEWNPPVKSALHHLAGVAAHDVAPRPASDRRVDGNARATRTSMRQFTRSPGGLLGWGLQRGSGRGLPRQASRDRHVDVRCVGGPWRLRSGQSAAPSRSRSPTSSPTATFALLVTSPERLALLHAGARTPARTSRRSSSSAATTKRCVRRSRRLSVAGHRLGRVRRRPTMLRRPRPASSTPTSRRSSTRPAAPASRRGWCSATATCSSAPQSVSHYLGNVAVRRHPRRPAAQLRRRLQPADDGVRGRCPRRAAQLRASPATSCEPAPATGSPG